MVKVALFVMSLPYSDAAPGCSSGRIPASAPSRPRIFQDGYVRAFEFFGAVPTRISYFQYRVADAMNFECLLAASVS